MARLTNEYCAYTPEGQKFFMEFDRTVESVMKKYADHENIFELEAMANSSVALFCAGFRLRYGIDKRNAAKLSRNR